MSKRNSINVHSNIPQLATGRPYRWFWNFFSGFAEGPRLFPLSWILHECNLYFKLWNTTFCPGSVWKKQRVLVLFHLRSDVYTSPDLLARFCKANLSNAKKFGLIRFTIICFPGLIYCDKDSLWLLNVIEDDWYFWGAHTRQSTRM